MIRFPEYVRLRGCHDELMSTRLIPFEDSIIRIFKARKLFMKIIIF